MPEDTVREFLDECQSMTVGAAVAGDFLVDMVAAGLADWQDPSLFVRLVTGRRLTNPDGLVWLAVEGAPLPDRSHGLRRPCPDRAAVAHTRRRPRPFANDLDAVGLPRSRSSGSGPLAPKLGLSERSLPWYTHTECSIRHESCGSSGNSRS
jgi:hypothetical protein